MSLLGSVVSLFTGGVTGLLGVVVQRGFDIANKAQDIKLASINNDHAIKMKETDGKLMAQEWAARTQVVSIESDAKKDVAESEAFKESMWKEPDRYSKPSDSKALVALDFIRGIIRPGLTIYLCAIVTLMYLEMRAMIAMKDVMLSVDVFSVYELIVNTVLYLFTTVVLWYFGTRNKGKQPGEK